MFIVCVSLFLTLDIVGGAIGATSTSSKLPLAAMGELLASLRAFDADAMYVFLYILYVCGCS